MLADLPEAADQLKASLALSNRLGHALFQSETAELLGLLHFFLGRWDEAERYAGKAVEINETAGLPDGRLVLVLLLASRGELDEAAQQLTTLDAMTDTDDPGRAAALDIARGITALARGGPEVALAAVVGVTHETFRTSGMLSDGFRLAWPLAMEAALAASRVDEAESLLALVADAPRGHVPPYLRAQLARCRALAAAARGDHDSVEVDLRHAVDAFRELGYPYWLARVQSDLGSWLVDQGRADEAEPLLTEAAETFTRLGALPDLDRLKPTAATG